MFGLAIPEMFVLGVLPTVGVVVAVFLLLTARREAEMSRELAAARRHQVGISVLAATAALISVPAGAVTFAMTDRPVPLAVLPALMVAVASCVLWAGEATFPRPSGSVRSTVLNPRSLGTVLPVGWLRAGLAVAGVDLVVFALGAVTAHGGRAVRWVDGDETHGASPYPGLDYVVPQLLFLAVAGLLGWLVCRAATARPTIATDLDGDAVLRRASAGRALRWLCWGLLATGAGDLTVAGQALHSVAPDGWQPLAIGVTGLGIIGVLATLVVPFLPVPRLPRVPVAPATTGAARVG